MKARQQGLVDALLGRGDPPPDLMASERGLATYRHNLQALSARALAGTFERVHAALGEDDFASLAWTFWRARPPAHGDLGEWGGELEAFLIERAGESSGLPDLARLDWALHQAERAEDVELDVESLNLMGTTPPETLWLRLRPGVALLAQQSGPLLVWRRGWRGESQGVSASEAAFFAAVLAGTSLAAALEAAEVKGSASEPDFDFGAWLQAALHHTWLHAVRSTPPHGTPTP
jgi:hypothetical protein